MKSGQQIRPQVGHLRPTPSNLAQPELTNLGVDFERSWAESAKICPTTTNVGQTSSTLHIWTRIGYISPNPESTNFGVGSANFFLSWPGIGQIRVDFVKVWLGFGQNCATTGGGNNIILERSSSTVA